MEECIFCKIIKGEIPSFKVFENEKVFAFLDINPLTPGHCLIVPKEHYENIFDIEEDNLVEIIKVAKSISLKLKEKLGAKGVQLLNASGKQAEQSIFHFHLHIVPRYEGDGLEMNNWWQQKSKKVTNEDLQKIKERLE